MRAVSSAACSCRCVLADAGASAVSLAFSSETLSAVISSASEAATRSPSACFAPAKSQKLRLLAFSLLARCRAAQAQAQAPLYGARVVAADSKSCRAMRTPCDHSTAALQEQSGAPKADARLTAGGPTGCAWALAGVRMSNCALCQQTMLRPR